MKIVLQLTSVGGNVELVTVEAGKNFTIPDGVTAEIVSLDGVKDLHVEAGELVLSGSGGTIRIAGFGADFLAEAASIDGIGIDGPLPAGFARFFGWTDTSDEGGTNGNAFGDTGHQKSSPAADDTPPPLDSSNDSLASAPDAPSISSFSDDTGLPGDGITADNTITLTGTAEAGATVTIYGDAIRLGTATADANGDWSFTTGALADGAHSFTATAENEGGAGTSSGPVDVTVDTEAPDIAIAMPLFGDGIVSGADDAALTLSGTSSGGSEVFVTFRDGSGATVSESGHVDGNGNWTISGADISGLENGTITVEAYAVDAAGNSSATTSETFELDNVAPAAPVITDYADDTGRPADRLTADATPTLSGTAEAGAEIEIYDGNTLLGTAMADGNGDWSFTTAALSDGLHSLTATARDAASNESASSSSFALTIDTEAPGIAISTPLSGDGAVNASEDGSLSVSGTAAGGQRVFVTFTDGSGAEVDGIAFVDGAGNWLLQHVDVSGLDEGTISVEAYAEDQAGNRSGTATASFTHDSLAPGTPAITGFSDDTGAPDDGHTSDDTLTLTGTAEANMTVEIFDGATSLGTATADGAGNWSFETQPLADGSHTFTARAEDAAGNKSPSSLSYNVEVDTLAPGVTLASPVSGDGFVNASEDNVLTLSGTADGGQRVFVTLTDGAGGFVSGQAAVSGTGTWTLNGIDISGLQNGGITIEAYAVDQAGNRSGTVNETVTLDNVMPAAPVITGFTDDTGNPGDNRTSDTTPTLAGTAEANGTVEIRDGAVLLGTANVDGSGNWSFTTGTLAEGSHSLTVRVVDEAGNRGPSANMTLSVDTTPPGIVITTPIAVDNIVNAAEDGSLSVSGTAAGGQRVFLTFTDEGGATATGEAVVTGAGTWTATGIDLSGLQNGGVTVEAYAVDQAGNRSGTVDAAVTLDNAAPAAPVIAGFSADTGTPGDQQTGDNTLTFTGTAEANATVNVYFAGNIVATGVADGDGNWSATTSAITDGYASFTARATDEAGNRSGSSDPYIVIIDTAAPDVPTITGYSQDTGAADDVTSDANLTLSGTAPADAARIAIYDNGVEIGTAIPAGGSWDFATGDLGDGDHSFTVAARDAAGNESGKTAALDVTIDTAAPDAPVITGFSDDTGAAGDGMTADTTLTLSGTAEADARIAIFDQGSLLGTVTADGAGYWSFDTGELAQAIHSFTARATDAAGNVSDPSDAFEVTVTVPATPAPAITGFTDDTGTVGDFRTGDTNLTLSGTSAADATVEIFRNGVSLGTATADGAGDWSFDTGELGEGAHAFTAVATAPASGQSPASATFNVTVDTTAPTVTIADPVDGDDLVGMTGAAALDVSGTATEGQIVEITFRDGLNATVTGSAAIDGVGNWVLTGTDISGLAEGTITVEAYTTDAAGNRSLTATHDFEFDGTASAKPVITDWSDDTGAADGSTSDTTLTFTGTAEANATVQIFRGGGLVATTTADGAGNWTMTTGEIGEGYAAFEARATDEAGNSSGWSDPVVINVDTTAPAMPAITGFSSDSGAAGDGLTNDRTPTLTGTGQAGSIVVIMDGGVEIGTTYVTGGGTWSFTTGTLGGGDHSFTAVARDGAGNESGETASLDLTIDATAPAVPVITGFSDDTGNADNQTTDNTLIFTGTAEANATVNIYVGVNIVATGVADGDGNWTASTGTMPDGWTYFYARAVDAAGNRSAQTGNVTVNIDTTPPDAPEITGFTNDNGTAPDDGISSYNWTQLSGTAAAGTTQVVVYDGGVEVGTAYVSGGSWTLLVSALPQGTHEFTAAGRDYVGNESGESDAVLFTVDQTPPAIPTLTGLSDDTGATGDFRTSDTTPTLSGTAEANATVTIRDGATVLGTALADSDGNWSYTTGTFSEGVHTITVKATDLAGRDSAYGDVQFVVIDTTAPNAPVITGFSDDSPPTGDGYTSDTTPTLSGTAEANSSVEIFANGLSLGTVTANGSGNWSFTTAELSEASYSFTAKATDSAGNVSDESTALDIVIGSAPPLETAAPVISSYSGDTGVAGDGATSDTTLTITGTAVAYAAIEIFDGGVSLGVTWANGSGNWSFATGTLAEGDHEFTAVATAQGGASASDPSAALDVTIDTTPPGTPAITGMSDDTGSSSSDNYTSDNTPTLTGTADADATVYIYDGGGLIGQTTADGAGNWSFTTGALSDAYHYLTARQADAAGNRSADSATHIVRIDTTAPTVAISTPIASDDIVNGNEDNYFNVSGTVSGAAQTVHVTFTDSLGATAGGTATVNGSSWMLSGANISGLENGEITVSAYAVDGAGNQSSPVTSTITLDNVAPAAPSITGLSDDTGSSGSDNQTSDTTPTLSGTAEADATVRIYDGGGYLGEATADGAGNWSFTTGALSDGYHYFTARQVDEAGNQSTGSPTRLVNIDTSAPTVSLSAPIATDNIVNGNEDNYFNVSGTVAGGAQSVHVTFTDSLGATVSGTAVANGSSWMLSGANISGLENGDITVSAYAVDSAGNQSSAATSTITLDNIGPATPVITGFVDDTGIANGQTSDTTPTLTGTAGAGEEVRIFFQGSQIAVTTADGNGDWSVTTSTLPEGYHYLTARAVDEAGNQGDASGIQVVWVDTTPPAAATIDSWSTDTGTVGDGITDDDTITLTGTRPGATLVNIYDNGVLLGTVPMTGTSWSYTTSVLPDGDHSFTVVALDGAGNESAASSALDITVQTVPPIAALDDTISSVPDGWSVFEGNGHAYSLIGADNYWTYAQSAAASALPGDSYLLTITSAEENDFATTINSGRLWLNATDVASEGNWVWQGGPESGTTFWVGDYTGSAVDGAYTNWATGQPSGVDPYGGDEDYLIRNSSAQWNDSFSYDTYSTARTVAEIGGNGQNYADNVNEDAPYTFSSSILLQNDGDGAAISSVSATSTMGASLTYNSGTGEVTYDPTAASSIQALGDGQTATDSFTYTIDGGESATVHIEVAGRDEVSAFSAMSMSVMPDAASVLDMSGEIPGLSDNGDTGTGAVAGVGDGAAFPYFDNGTQHLLVQDPASDNGSLPAVA
ncbi:VCBS repeat-containing protein [Parvibaculum indicum]|uniref:Ig-like domain-containing protein n=1 Tax=Parvibaculum indicum TaxID=562969 RepID=UPI00141E1A60|nr:Ig-like domain-containing protein [Parvibaculum indicum]NIJ42558.1 VCBS repeat-containing protein [Parvibaculum indicum]